MISQRFEFIRSSNERKTREVCDFPGDKNIITCRCIESGAYGCSAQRQFPHCFQRIFECANAVVDLLNITGKFLAECEWGCVHEVSAAGLNYRLELTYFFIERIPKSF